MARLQVAITPAPGSTGLRVFLDWMKAEFSGTGWEQLRKSSDNSVINDTAIQPAGFVDGNWNLTSVTGLNRVSRYLVNLNPTIAGPSPDYSGRNMTLEWSGQTVTGITGLNLSSIDNSQIASRKATFTLGVNPCTFNMAINPAAGDGSPPTNWRCYETSKKSQLDAGNLIDQDWVDYHKKFAVLRLMDAMGTNWSGAVDYADIATTSDQVWGEGSKAYGLKTGWPVAALIEIANRTGCALWINIPHKFTNAATTSLLTALRDGITFSGSAVRLHIEYSNEVWNSGFSDANAPGTTASGRSGQNTYAQAQATHAGGVDDFGNDVTWTSGGSVTQGRQWYGLRAAQVMEIARTVFGTDSGNKWVGKLATQCVATSVTTNALSGVARHISADAGAASVLTKLFSNLSLAPYIGPVPSSDSTEPALSLLPQLAISQSAFNTFLYNKVKLGGGTDGNYGTSDAYRATWIAQKVIADANGLVVDAYEMGLNCVTTTAIENSSLLVQAFANFCRSELAGQLIFDNMEQFVADTGGMASQFAALGASTKKGHWGAATSPTDYSPRANASVAHNLGIPHIQGKRNMRLAMTA